VPATPADKPTEPRAGRHRSLLRPLLIGLVTALLALGFFHLGSEILEGETLHVDEAVQRGAKALRQAHPWLVPAMRELSALGGAVALSPHISRIGPWMDSGVIPASFLSSSCATQAIR
jgi:hypothetical protein